jgi:hypothetical protein
MWSRPSLPASRFVTIAITSLVPSRDDVTIIIILKNGSKIFFAKGLDTIFRDATDLPDK